MSGQLEARITLLEAEVKQLKLKLEPKLGNTSDTAMASLNQPKRLPLPQPWWEQIAESFADDPVYDEAMRLGREYRKSSRKNAEMSTDKQ